MIINELLVEKYRTQKILDEMANHDLTQYVSDTHIRIKELATQLGLKLKYGKPDSSSQDISPHV